MSKRKWRVIIVRKDGKRFRYGGGKSGRGQGYGFVSERAARKIADDLEKVIAEDRAFRGDIGRDSHCEVEEFDFIEPPPQRVSPLAQPPRFN